MNGKNYKVPHRGDFYTFHFHPSLFGPNTRLSILFSNTLSLCFSINIRAHVSHPYSTTDNIIVLYILSFKLFERTQESKSVWDEYIGAGGTCFT